MNQPRLSKIPETFGACFARSEGYGGLASFTARGEILLLSVSGTPLQLGASTGGNGEDTFIIPKESDREQLAHRLLEEENRKKKRKSEFFSGNLDVFVITLCAGNLLP